MKTLFLTKPAHLLKHGRIGHQINYTPSNDIKKWLGKFTKNTGNLVHNDAITEILGSENSSRGQVDELIKECGDIEQFRRIVNNNYDRVVVSLANNLRPGYECKSLCKALEQIDIPIHIFGLGLQSAIDYNTLSESNKRFLDIANNKALTLGVRGEYTESFLHRNGINKAQALGCPSMFAYERNVQSVDFSNHNIYSYDRIFSAGHINKTHFPSSQIKENRATRLIDIFSKLSPQHCSYILQDEPHTYEEMREVIIDNSCGKLNSEVIDYLTSKFNMNIPFHDFYMFNETQSWRTLASTYDLYIGDRFHGGVVALQTGKPAYFLGNDLRLKELCEFFNLPLATPHAFKTSVNGTFKTEMSKAHENFKRTYAKRLANFKSAIANI